MRRKTEIALFLLLLFMIGCVERSTKLSKCIGTHFPGDSQRLYKMITDMEADASPDTFPRQISMLISPHGAYRYAGKVMASAYAELSFENYASYKRIVLISFYEGRENLVPDFPDFMIPGKMVPMETEFASETVKKQLALHADGFFPGFSPFEVQLPFIAHHFPGLKVLPVALGTGDPSKVMSLLAFLGKKRADTLFIVTFNLSISIPEKIAFQDDREIIDALLKLEKSPVRRPYSPFLKEIYGLAGEGNGERQIKMTGYSDDIKPLFQDGPLTTYGGFVFYRRISR